MPENEPDYRADLEKARDENSKLRADLSKLKEDLSYAQGESRDRKVQIREMTRTMDEVTRERDTFKGQAETGPNQWKEKVEALTTELRTYKHKDVYAKVAKELKVTDPAKFNDLVMVAGYRPEGDEPDESKIKDAFTRAVASRSWLVDAQTAPDGAKTAPVGAQTAPVGANGALTPLSAHGSGPGSDRGQTVQPQPSGQPPSPRPLGRL